ncbi:pyruvate ferredoxin oxidoreductase [Candidatus Falkowbacteria bacterium CG23_combo_of_CG06-09_8_20_14_all_49_15]|uniref:Pyruvate ferredoxin oxidoreductase n=1 Tax=Candidatus Falkowbacteria bacterium CG23_combo_of_CG06-09_8_20_14_all_49_15 TaxID=1974572 RepID=A0A2G9ZKT2_9BACT|nr:MAG: pyruvate ferredoxin oxidoreductase [Candidatus Falkowbacteria bacterium CG23_combo_of_CG06-09_8_20_14_all_49_15]
MSTNKSTITKPTTKNLFAPGHRACAGCGQVLAARTVLEALGPGTIIANATGCLEVTTTPYPQSAWGVPWIHSLFENAAAIATGVRAALDYREKIKATGRAVKVVAQGGDGATFDIGFGLISGMWERDDDILYICYDNEAYANTGVQASGATPLGANTTTTPPGKKPSPDNLGARQRKKDMLAIALAHGVPYVAQSTAGFLDDIARKVKKARTIKGPAYLQILVPCIPGWGIKPEDTIQAGKLAAQTGLYPLLEFENGQLVSAGKVPRPTPTAAYYLKMQKRFAHLFKSPAGAEQITAIQKIAEENIKKYNL